MEVVGVDGGGGDGRLDGGWLELDGKRVAGRLDGRGAWSESWMEVRRAGWRGGGAGGMGGAGWRWEGLEKGGWGCKGLWRGAGWRRDWGLRMEARMEGRAGGLVNKGGWKVSG